jgi:hypothetical protein
MPRPPQVADADNQTQGNQKRLAQNSLDSNVKLVG